MHFLILAITLAAPHNDRALYDRLSAQVEPAFDAKRNAFVEKGGSPSTPALELAIRRAAEDGGDAWRERAVGTMAFTWTLFDSVGGGFVHEDKHANPAHPSFEKRADSNAQRLSNLLDLMAAGYGDPAEGRAEQVVDYFDRVLLDGRGGFMPSQVGDRFLLAEINGMALHAWLRWSAATGDLRKRDFAIKSLDRVWEHCWDERFGMMRKGDFDVVISPPLLVDQVEFGRACVLSAQVMGRDVDRERAVQLGEVILGRFEDAKKGGGFYTKAVPDKDGATKKSGVDLAENARAARFLCELSTMTGEPKYRDAARRAWTVLGEKIAKESLGAAEWALAVRESFAPTTWAKAEWPEPQEKKPRPRSVRFKARR